MDVSVTTVIEGGSRRESLMWRGKLAHCQVEVGNPAPCQLSDRNMADRVAASADGVL